MERRRRMKRVIWIGILLIRAVYYHEIMYFAEETQYYKLYYSEDESIEREKIVLCFEEGMEVERRYNEEKNIILNDSSQYFIDYKKETDSILYVNNEGEVVEKYLETGREERIEIPQIPQRIKREEKEERRSFYAQKYGTMEEVRKDPSYYNVQYGPGEKEISFVYKGILYTYNREKKEIEEITECEGSDYRNTYQWINKDEAYILCRDEDWATIYLWRRGNKETKVTENDNIDSFQVSRDVNQILCNRLFSKSMDSIIITTVKIVLADAMGKERVELEELGVENKVNYVLKHVSDQYIIYIKQGKGKIKSKVYRLDLETGKKKCICWTDHEVMGIIVK